MLVIKTDNNYKLVFTMKIAFIIGTRPEIIKMAPIIDEVQKRALDYIIIHTGQHYDQKMSEQFFRDLKLPHPHYNIGVGSNSHGKQTAQMLEGIEKILLSENPDVVLIEGDTNAVLAGAIASSKLNLTLGHVEAGLRSFDKTMPEEINRTVADVCSTLFFVPTEESALNLLFEGITSQNIFITGNSVVDSCIRNLKIAKKHSSLNSNLDLQGDILTLTLHRAENVDYPQRLRNILEALLELEEMNIIFPVHPRTEKNLKKYGFHDILNQAKHIQMIKPIAYLQFLLLLSNSKLVMTDSGGIQEEAITLDLPCVTIRYNTERPETVTAGGNILLGAQKESIIQGVRKIMRDPVLYQKMKDAYNPYGDGKASKMILDAIMKLYHENKLKITQPNHITSHKGYYIQKIEETINVQEFENKNIHFRIKAVFEDGLAKFPHPNLPLKNKTVLVDKYITKTD